MNLCFTLLILFAVLNGSFCKKAQRKRSVHKRSAPAKITKLGGNLSIPAFGSHQPSRNLTKATTFVTNYPTAQADLTLLSNSTDSTRPTNNYITSEVALRLLNVNSTNFAGNFSTAEVQLKHPSSSPPNSTDFASNFLIPHIYRKLPDIRSTDSTNGSTLQIHPKCPNNDTAAEDGISGIIVYEDQLILQQSLIDKVREFLISVFTNKEQRGILNATKEDYTSDDIQNKVKRDDFGNFIKRIKNTAVESSKQVTNATKNIGESIKADVKKLVTRNASFPNNRSYVEPNEVLLVRAPNDTKILAILKQNLEGVQNKSTLNELIENIQPTPKETPFEENKVAPTISESVIKPATQSKTIDKHTKYFFGEVTTEPDTDAHRTVNEGIADVTGGETKEQAVSLKQERDYFDLSKCRDREHCLQRKDDSTNSLDLENVILEDNKINTLISSQFSSSQKPGTTKDTSNMLTSFIRHSESTTDGSFKMDVREDFFKYKDWLWQHLEAVRNGSLKSNSTEQFLKAHHFLLNSGGTDQSATDVSEFYTVLFANQSGEAEVEPTLYKLHLEEQNLSQNINMSSDGPVKRHGRIKRNPKSDKKDETMKQIITEPDATTLGDEEVTLPEGEVESIFPPNTETAITTEVTVTTLDTTTINTSNIITTSKSETPVTDTATTDETTFNEESFPSETVIVTSDKTEPESKFTSDTDTESLSLTREALTQETILSESDRLPLTKNEYSETVTSDDGETSITTTIVNEPYNKRNANIEKEYNDGGGIRTRPLLLLVTIPSFIGIGIFILALCYVTRSGGWCCQLFDMHRPSQASLAKEFQQPSASQPRPRTIYY